MKIKIKITKEILKESWLCSPEICKQRGSSVGESCAFALAVRDLLPKAAVGYSDIFPFGSNWGSGITPVCFPITQAMKSFIIQFDRSTPLMRLKFDEEEFELELPDWVVDNIGDGNVEETKRIISQSKTLELV